MILMDRWAWVSCCSWTYVNVFAFCDITYTMNSQQAVFAAWFLGVGDVTIFYCIVINYAAFLSVSSTLSLLKEPRPLYV